MKLFCKKTQNFQALGAQPPDPRASGGWGLRPQTPKTAPPIANFWLRAWSQSTYAAKTHRVFGEDLFFGLHLLLNQKPTDFWRCDLFFGLH